jgi:hypothetical protein
LRLFICANPPRTIRRWRRRPTERTRARASELAATAIDSLPVADADDQASRKRRLLKGPEEFRELRVDRLKAKGK